MTEQEYNSKPGIRRSALWKLKKSPKHFQYELEHPSEPTQAMVFGSAVHSAVLTPEAFKEQYSVIDADLRTREGKLAKQAALEAGKILLTKEQFDAVNGICGSLMGDAFARRLLTGQHETPYFWVDDVTGEECKCRTDCETDVDGQHYIVDLKTCEDASEDAFMRKAIQYGYFMQAAMYTEGVKHCTGKDSVFIFVCVEKTEPYAVNCIMCGENEILLGLDGDKYGKVPGFRELIGKYHMCKERNEWPGYNGFDHMINTFDLPKYLLEGSE